MAAQAAPGAVYQLQKVQDAARFQSGVKSPQAAR
jgi:hypothetical protein